VAVEGVVGESGGTGLVVGVLPSDGVAKTSSSPVVITLDLWLVDRWLVHVSGLSTVILD
jgi:hypothetical protein